MRFFIAACTLLIVTLQQSALPELKDLPSSTFLVDQFVSTTSDASWIRSRASKDEATPDLAQYDGKWSIEVPSKSAFPNDYGLVMKSKARHHAIAKSLNSDFDFKKEKSLIVQYEVRFQDPPHECGGAYVKLLTSSDNEPLDQFSDSRPYTVMFGPDKCGHNHKLHFIVRFKNPLTGIISEHHSSNASSIDDKVFSDGFTHLYRLRIDSNDDFITFVDNERVQSGNLRTDLEPPIVPPEEIDDELDQKPDSWDDRPQIPDESAKKPNDWDEDAPLQIPDKFDEKPEDWLDDEPSHVPDENAVRPDDYDPEVDGEWEAPIIPNPKCEGRSGCGEWKPRMIPNPDYKGKWSPPMIKNPDYAGPWFPRKIPNPAYFKLDGNVFHAMDPISALGLELWTLSSDVVFDDFVVVGAKDESVPRRFAQEIWKVKYDAEKAAAPETSSTKNVMDTLAQKVGQKPWVAAGVVVSVFVVIVTIISFVVTGRKTPAPVQEDIQEDQVKPNEDGSADEHVVEEDDSKENSKENGEEEEETGPVKRSKVRIDQ